MKYCITIIPLILPFWLLAQHKNDHIHFNKLFEVVGTEYVIASTENWSKNSHAANDELIFINSKTGANKKIGLPHGSRIGELEQITIESLAINLILVGARSSDMDGKGGIDRNDPTQLFILSINGERTHQLTDNKFFVRTWAVNHLTGTLVVTCHADTNANNKYELSDADRILIYDLRTFDLVDPSIPPEQKD